MFNVCAFLLVLTMKSKNHDGTACFEITHNHVRYSLKVINPTKIVFEVSKPVFKCVIVSVV